MTEDKKDCSICYESFFYPKNIDEGIFFYNKEVTEKTNDFIIKNFIFSKREKRYIMRQNLKNFYKRFWYPNFKQYKCSTENCCTVICGNCVEQIEWKSYSFVFKCTHCRLYDWKQYMTKYVFPEMIMIYLSRTSGNGIFSMRDFAKAGFL